MTDLSFCKIDASSKHMESLVRQVSSKCKRKGRLLKGICYDTVYDLHEGTSIVLLAAPYHTVAEIGEVSKALKQKLNISEVKVVLIPGDWLIDQPTEVGAV